MNRFPIFAGAAALIVALPCIALSAPTGGAVNRAAPVVVRPAFPQRAGEQSRDDFKVPFHADAAPKPRMPDTMRVPTSQWITRPQWTWRPNYVYLNGPCFANGANWTSLQNTTASQSSLNDVTIGSLAGNPKHNALSMSPSDIAHLASSSTNAGDASSNGTGLQIQFQPSACGQQW
ncbi:MAG TPA: hypothetical protein VKR05_01340 [Candidatus Cybelea sp.]|nr:hypothetical protein [Candidatus Cybelea sp.]